MDERLDPDMRAAKKLMDEAAARMPPISLMLPIDASRMINDELLLPLAQGGPNMHETREIWVSAQGRRILCRLHRPIDALNLPVLVWFHGGGWVFSSIDTHDRLVRDLAAAGNVATINVDYSLSPEAKFPRAVLEAADVVRQIAVHARAWGLNPDRIAIGGDSAGGNLALGAAMLLRDTNGPMLSALLTAYPVTDAACDSPTYQEFAEGYGLTRAGMVAYWECYLANQADRLNPIASPLRGDCAGLPPSYVFVAELDVLRDEGIAMAKKLEAAGVETVLDICPGMLHGFARLTEHVGVARAVIARAGAWLAGVLA